MKKRIHLKNHVHIKKRSIYLIILTVIAICLGILLNNINKKFSPILFETAETEINKFSTIIINKAISQVLGDKINTEDLFLTSTSEKGEIQTIDFNPIVVNQVLNIATTTAQENLKLLEEGNLNNLKEYGYTNTKQIKKLKKGIIAEIPMGVVFKNSILANIGPKIPIRLHYLGDVNSNIKTKITPYGINNAMVEIGVHLEITAQIVLPFLTKKTVLVCTIPLAIKIIQGSIPNYYGNGLLKDSNIYSIPFE